MCFGWVRDWVFYKPTGSVMTQAPKSEMTSGAKRAPLQVAWLETDARVPSYRSIAFKLPIKKTDPLKIEIIAADAPNYDAMSDLFLDAYSGRVLRYDPFEGKSLGDRLYSWNKPFHTGLMGGPFGQFIALLGTLGLAGMVITGLWLWIRRKFKANRKTAPMKCSESKDAAGPGQASVTAQAPNR